MEQTEQLFKKYQAEIRKVLAGYLNLYFDAHEHDYNTMAAGRDFLKSYNEPYKKDISATAAAALREAGADMSLYSKVYRHSQTAANALFHEIMNLALNIETCTLQ